MDECPCSDTRRIPGGPSFTPDGKALVYTRDPSPSQNGLWTIGTDGTGLRQLTANPFIHDGECGCDGGAKVSPDGRAVAFVRTKRDNVTQALFSIGIDGNGLRPLLPYTLVVGTHLDWSPDGKRIAVTIGANLAANVATVDSNGENLRWVTRFKGGVRNAFVGGYSPDGRWPDPHRPARHAWAVPRASRRDRPASGPTSRATSSADRLGRGT